MYLAVGGTYIDKINMDFNDCVAISIAIISFFPTVLLTISLHLMCYSTASNTPRPDFVFDHF
jgi:hypothetical protein